MTFISIIHKIRNELTNFRKTDKGLFNPRLTKMELSTGFKLSGKQFGINQDKDTTSTTVAPDSINIFPLSTQNKSQGGALWNTRFSVGYSLNKFDPVNTSRNILDEYKFHYQYYPKMACELYSQI